MQIIGNFKEWIQTRINRRMSPRKKFNFFLLHLIKEIHEKSEKVYGGEKIHQEVLKKGFICSQKLVEKLMKIAKIRSKINRKFKVNTTDSNHKYKIAENLLDRNFDVKEPNKVWVSDISYIRVGTVWMYLCVIIDLFNREVISWNLQPYLEKEILLKAFEDAIKKRKPGKGCMFHSDRGVQYACDEFKIILEKSNMIQSMSRKGNCWDNAVAESFFKSLKVERVYHKQYSRIEEAREDLFQYIEFFYNRKRSHSSLGFTSPNEYLKMYYKKVA